MNGGVLQSLAAFGGIALSNTNDVISISGQTLNTRIDNVVLELTQSINDLNASKQSVIQEATLNTILKTTR